jgi:hypothetical protein
LAVGWESKQQTPAGIQTARGLVAIAALGSEEERCIWQLLALQLKNQDGMRQLQEGGSMAQLIAFKAMLGFSKTAVTDGARQRGLPGRLSPSPKSGRPCLSLGACRE